MLKTIAKCAGKPTKCIKGIYIYISKPIKENHKAHIYSSPLCMGTERWSCKKKCKGEDGNIKNLPNSLIGVWERGKEALEKAKSEMEWDLTKAAEDLMNVETYPIISASP